MFWRECLQSNRRFGRDAPNDDLIEIREPELLQLTWRDAAADRRQGYFVAAVALYREREMGR